MVNSCKNYNRILTRDQDPDIDAIYLSYWKISLFTCTPVCAHVYSVLCNVITDVDLRTYHHSQDTEQFFQIKSSSFLLFESALSSFQPHSYIQKPWISYMYF